MAQPIAFLTDHPEVQSIDLLVSDINGILRGKRLRAAELQKAVESGFCLPQSLYGSDVTGATVESTRLGHPTGDQDVLCFPDLATLQPVPWTDSGAAQCLFEMQTPEGEPFPASPRHQLIAVTDRLHKRGLFPTVAVELEFYLFQGRLDDQGRPQMLTDPMTGQTLSGVQVYSMDDLDRFRPFTDLVQRYCEIQQVPATAAVAEYAPGQFEINLAHGADPVAACDQAQYLKRIIRRAAAEQGLLASFMARPLADQTGSGTHVHVSLCDEQGDNRLRDDTALLHRAIAGLQATMAEAMALWAPHANSFRRFREQAYVPLSPTWGFNNRTVALRIPAGPDSARRVEHRVAGADANPYLVMAGVLAGIGHGVEEDLTPDAPREGDAAKATERGLPLDWLGAIEAFEASAWARDWFGDSLVNLVGQIKRCEYERAREHISDLDYAWYLTTV